MLASITLRIGPVQIAKQLADCVIPNEYGIDAGSKMRIGSKICCALLGKLLADLSNMQEESIATAVSSQCSSPYPCPISRPQRAPCKALQLSQEERPGHLALS